MSTCVGSQTCSSDQKEKNSDFVSLYKEYIDTSLCIPACTRLGEPYHEMAIAFLKLVQTWIRARRSCGETSMKISTCLWPSSSLLLQKIFQSKAYKVSEVDNEKITIYW